MSYEGYQEALESQKEKEDKLTVMEERFNTIQSQMRYNNSGIHGTVRKDHVRKTIV